MNTKLTLKLNKRAIERAKKYAQKNNQSLSIMVENYFNMVADSDNSNEIEISPNVLELSGIISVPENFEAKKLYRQHIEEKYNS